LSKLSQQQELTPSEKSRKRAPSESSLASNPQDQAGVGFLESINRDSSARKKLPKKEKVNIFFLQKLSLQ